MDSRTNLLSQLCYFKSFEIKDFLHFSKIIYLLHLQLTSEIHILGLFLLLYCNISETVRAFDLIPSLRARHQYQLSCSEIDGTTRNKIVNGQPLKKPNLTLLTHI